MSQILGKYTNKRRLGGGAFGDVQLVVDPQGNQRALKMISKRIIVKEPYMEEYIEGEKECMMSLKSPYVVRLYNVEEDQKYKYFVCEYCDGGDLLSLQAKQQNKVFSLKDATKILSQVILGLEHVHKSGYLHRDIKLQNILYSKGKTQNIFKIADFGFAKKVQNVNGTVLGTENYMSPEIYLNQVYSFEVDMWAFGVLFYFMLNMEFPFIFPNSHSKPEQKRLDLIKYAKNFSYKAAVSNSSKKLMGNCTPEIEDLFKKMFDPDASKRINFAQIRLHPVFKEYFPNPDKQLFKIYEQNPGINKLDSFRMNKMSAVQLKAPQKTVQKYILSGNDDDSQIDISPSCFLKKPKTTQQNQIVLLELEKISFLSEAVEELSFNISFVDPEEIVAFRYNVFKYYVVLLRDLRKGFKPEVYMKKFPKLKWDTYFKSAEATATKQEIQKYIDEAEMRVSQSYDQCKTSLASIKKINPKIEPILQRQVSQTEFSPSLKASYRSSTSGLYNKLSEKANTTPKYTYQTLLILMIHAFNNIIKTEEEDLQSIFTDFEKVNKGPMIDFRILKGWLSELDKGKLKNLINVINKTYFSG